MSRTLCTLATFLLLQTPLHAEQNSTGLDDQFTKSVNLFIAGGWSHHPFEDGDTEIRIVERLLNSNPGNRTKIEYAYCVIGTTDDASGKIFIKIKKNPAIAWPVQLNQCANIQTFGHLDIYAKLKGSDLMLMFKRVGTNRYDQ